jgi:cellulose biosynthesis protein BcsQ
MIITVWGSSGSGKTTLTANLALALAGQRYMVGVIDARLDYAELPMLYGQRVFSRHGIFMAIKDGDAKAHFWKSDIDPNLFVLSVPNEYSGFEGETVTLEQTKQLLSQSNEHFDFVLVDGHESTRNAISSVSLTMARYILPVHKPTLKSYSWHMSAQTAVSLLHLEEKLIPVLNPANQLYETAAYLSKVDVRPDYTLPIVPNAPLLGEMGRPIYQTGERGAKEYRNVLCALAERLINAKEESR